MSSNGSVILIAWEYNENSSTQSAGAISFSPNELQLPGSLLNRYKSEEASFLSSNQSSIASKVVSHQQDKDNHEDLECASSGIKETERQPSLTSIRFPTNSHLYGREHEESALIEAFYRRVSANPVAELIIISGESGTGKTALAQTLREPARHKGGYFLSGKFDQLQRSEPYAPFVAAFTEFTEYVIDKGPGIVESVKNSIDEAIGSEGRLLIDTIPALELILGPQTASSTIKGAHAQVRFEIAFCSFVRAICSPKIPLVLLIDDLQWGDPTSLDVLQELASSHHSGLMILCTCRKVKKTYHEKVAGMLSRLSYERSVCITDIELQNLQLKDINDMVSGLLRQSPHASQQLAYIIHTRSNGNIFFALEILKYLYEEKGLDTDMFVDHTTHVNEMVPFRDIEELQKAKMKKIPEEAQEVLKVASCIGAEFDEYLLLHVLPPELVACGLNTAKKRGFILFDCCSGCYRFAQDQVQQAAYLLISENDRNAFHISIGRKLLKQLSDDDVAMNIFLVVNQLTRDCTLLCDQDEKDMIAILCLNAGEKAAGVSGFVTSAEYLTLGIDLLEKQHWRDTYDLSLALYSTAAEIKCCTGDYTQMSSLIEEITLNARSCLDKNRAYTTQVYSLFRLERPREAIHVAFDFVEQLGESFPRKGSRIALITEFAKLRRVLRGKSNKELLTLPLMTDPDKIATMLMLCRLQWYCFVSVPEFVPFLVMRMVRLSVTHGLSSVSPSAFSSYGVLLVGSGLCTVELGYGYGQLAWSMMDRFKGKREMLLVTLIIEGFMNPRKIPIRTSFEPLLHAYKVGIGSGDTEISFACAIRACMAGYYSGIQLAPLEKPIRTLLETIGTFRNTSVTRLIGAYLQTVVNLSRESRSPSRLSGDIFDFDALSHQVGRTILTTFVSARNQCYTLSVQLAYIFNDYSLAGSMAGNANISSLSYQRGHQFFYEGLTYLALASEKEGRRRHIRMAGKCLKKLKRFAQHCPQNWSNKVLLMKAEFYALKGDMRRSNESFLESIIVADREGFLPEQAIASERAGLAWRRDGNEHEAGLLLASARSLYLQWGAHAKVEQMASAIP